MLESQQFSKYQDRGAYHWARTYSVNGLRRSPRLVARYELSIRVLAQRLMLRTSRGIDVGCGDGVWLYRMAKFGGHVMGIDASETGVQLARQNLRAHGYPDVSVQVGSCYALPVASSSMDFVAATELIEHLEAVTRFLDEVSRVLRPGGWFVCTTPNRRVDQEPDAVRDPFHIHEFSAVELKETLAAYFDEVVVYGSNPLWLDRLSTPGSSVPLISKGISLLYRLLSWIGFNPYLRITTKTPTPHWGQLVAIGCKR